jgi:hypothetical protein
MAITFCCFLKLKEGTPRQAARRSREKCKENQEARDNHADTENIEESWKDDQPDDDAQTIWRRGLMVAAATAHVGLFVRPHSATAKGRSMSSISRITCTADHFPPRAAGMPRSSSPASVVRNDSEPAACSAAALMQTATRPHCTDFYHGFAQSSQAAPRGLCRHLQCVEIIAGRRPDCHHSQ